MTVPQKRVPQKRQTHANRGDDAPRKLHAMMRGSTRQRASATADIHLCGHHRTIAGYRLFNPFPLSFGISLAYRRSPSPACRPGHPSVHNRSGRACRPVPSMT